MIPKFWYPLLLLSKLYLRHDYYKVKTVSLNITINSGIMYWKYTLMIDQSFVSYSRNGWLITRKSNL